MALNIAIMNVTMTALMNTTMPALMNTTMPELMNTTMPVLLNTTMPILLNKTMKSTMNMTLPAPVNPTRNERMNGSSLEVFQRTPGCITVSITAIPPFSVTRTKPFSGPLIQIFRLYMQLLKWCYYMVKPDDGLWAIHPNGTAAGMIGMLHTKEADVSLGPHTLSTYQFAKYGDFAYPIIPVTVVFMYKKSEAGADLVIFTRPLLLVVWAGMLISVLVVGVVAVGIHHANNFIKEPGGAAEGGSRGRESGSIYMLWSLMIFLAQDGVHSPRGDAGRMLAVTWMFVALMFALTYKCNLKAILIAPKTSKPFDSMAEFVEQSTYKWTTIKGMYYPRYFKMQERENPDSVEGKMMKNFDTVIDAARIIPTILKHKISVVNPRIVYDGIVSAYFSKNAECPFTCTKGYFHPGFIGHLYAKDSPIRDRMDVAIMRVVQSGLVDYLMQQPLHNSTWCDVSHQKHESRPFSLGDYLGVFAVYGMGMFLACFSFVLEVAYQRILTFGGAAKQK